MNHRLASLLLFALTILAALRTGNSVTAAQTVDEFTRDASGRVSLKFERGSKITVGNRTTGPIVVIGWDRNIVEATAFSERGNETVRARIDPGSGGSGIWLKADYASREMNFPWSAQPTVKADVPVLPPTSVSSQETAPSTSPAPIARMSAR